MSGQKNPLRLVLWGCSSPVHFTHCHRGAHLPDIYQDIKEGRSILGSWVKARPPVYMKGFAKANDSVLRRRSSSDRAFVHRNDAFMAHPVVESWIMRAYHGGVDFCGRVTALFPLIESAYRQRGRAQPSRRLAVEAAIYRSPGTLAAKATSRLSFWNCTSAGLRCKEC